MSHELHFVLGKKLHNELIGLSKIYKKSISKTMVLILDTLDTFLEKNDLMAKEKEHKYLIIDKDDNARYDIHCYISESQYRKLRFAYYTLNFFSIAQIVRTLIEYFVRAKLKYGFEKLVKKLYDIKILWAEMKKNYVNDKRVFLRQFSDNSIKFLITCSPNSSPISITLIE